MDRDESCSAPPTRFPPCSAQAASWRRYGRERCIQYFQLMTSLQADSYNPMIVIQGGREVSSLITLRPETRHSATLRVLRPILTKSAVLELEDVIDGTIATLSAELKQVWPILNINEWLSFFALDTVFRISFGQDLGCMRHKTDVDGVLAGAKGRFKHWHDWLAMPWLEGLWFRNRFFPAAQRQTELSRLITKRIALQKMRIGERSALLDKILPLHEAHPDIITEAAVSGISVSLIHAGAETIAMTMTAVIYNLAKNPAALEKLLEELRTNGVTTASKFAELDKLPYLEAVIKESMRLIPTTNDMLERVVPVGGVDIAGIFVPSGTTVSVSHHALYRNPHVFGPDVDEYNPDRWLQVDTKQRQAMERASLHWGGGKRICTGQHIAWLEMKKLLAHLVQTFEVRARLARYSGRCFSHLIAHVLAGRPHQPG